MVFYVVGARGEGWDKNILKNLNSTLYLTIWLFEYGYCPLDNLKWNWALSDVSNISNLDVRHSLTGKATLSKDKLKIIKNVWKVLYQMNLNKASVVLFK